MKIDLGVILELILGSVFFLVGSTIVITLLINDSVSVAFVCSVFPIFGGFLLYQCYQCNAYNGKWAAVPGNGGYRTVKRTSLSESEMEDIFGFDYKRYMPRTDPFSNSQNTAQGENPLSEPDNIGLIIGSALFIIMGSVVMVGGIISDNLPVILFGGIFVTIGVVINLNMIYKRRVYRGEAIPHGPAKKAAISGNLLPGVVFSSIGGVVLFFGISFNNNWILIILGGIFLLFGIYMLYSFIQCMRPNGNKVTMEIGDGSYVTVDRSKVTEEEYRDITDADGPSDQTINKVVSRSTNFPLTFLILAIISLGISVFILVSSRGVIIANIIFSLPIIAFSLFCFYMCIYLKKSDEDDSTAVTPEGPLPVDKKDLTDDEPETVFGPEGTREKPQQSYQPPTYRYTDNSSRRNKNKPANGVYKYVNCPHCGAINIEGNKTCYSCKKKI